MSSNKINLGKNMKFDYFPTNSDIKNAGGIYTDLPAVIDKNIVTTAHYKDLGPWMRAALSLL